MYVSYGHCDSVIKVWLYEKIQRFVNRFKSQMFKVSWSEKAFLLAFIWLFFLFFPKLQCKYKQNINKIEYTKIVQYWCFYGRRQNKGDDREGACGQLKVKLRILKILKLCKYPPHPAFYFEATKWGWRNFQL